MTDEERYHAAAHRIQTAIAAMPDHPNQTPKHLRVGVDLSKSDMLGLVRLLIARGILTEEEYIGTLADAAEAEADRYEAEVSRRYGVPVRTV